MWWGTLDRRQDQPEERKRLKHLAALGKGSGRLVIDWRRHNEDLLRNYREAQCLAAIFILPKAHGAGVRGFKTLQMLQRQSTRTTDLH